MTVSRSDNQEPQPEQVEFEVRSEDVQAMLNRAREIDPSADEAAIRGYIREIMEADAVLDSINLDNVPLNVSFVPSWEEVSQE